MKAIVKTKPGRGIEVLDRPMPQVGENDVLIRVKAASLCGSDLHVYEWIPSLQWVPTPVTLGHEFSGEVVQVGPGVCTVKVGDRVTALPAYACGLCAACRIGRSDRCVNRKLPGLMLSDGFFAEYVCLPETAEILRLPERVSFEAGSLTEPLAVALSAVDAGRPELGCRAAVIGPGPIGLFILRLLKLAGAGLVMVTGTSRDQARLAMAERFGADVVVNVDQEDPVSKAMALTGGRVGLIAMGGLDLVFEAAGVPSCIGQALSMVRRGGKVVVAGIHPGPAQINPVDLVMSNKTLQGVLGYELPHWHRALDLMSSGRVEPEALITHRLPLDQAEEGFELAARKEAIKVVFTP